jgi:hypothetical protein
MMAEELNPAEKIVVVILKGVVWLKAAAHKHGESRQRPSA